jgi:hypothetical protein
MTEGIDTITEAVMPFAATAEAGFEINLPHDRDPLHISLEDG